jgi:hypothetical protein
VQDGGASARLGQMITYDEGPIFLKEISIVQQKIKTEKLVNQNKVINEI